MQFLEHAWGFVGYLVPFLFVIIVVFFHELGHFLVGRWCGVKVDAFSIGFGPEITSFTDKKTGTRWRFAWLPLGGYVKFHGDANGASGGLGVCSRGSLDCCGGPLFIIIRHIKS